MFGDGGDDTVSILTVPVDRTYTVDGGDADDAVTIGQAGTLDAILGVGSVIGGTGLDTLTVDDSADGEANAYTLTTSPITTLARGGAGTITYGTLEALIIHAGVGSDAIAIQGTAAGTPVTVTAGDGDDALAIGTGTLDNLLSAVNVDGGDGLDLLSLNDATDGTDNTYSIDTTRMSRTNGPAVSVDFTAIDQLLFAAGTGDDSIDIRATAAATPLTVNAGAGSDGVSVGGGSLDNLLGMLTLNADLGIDTLTVDDSADADDNNYSITNAAVERSNGTAVTFAYPAQGFESLLLSAGIGDDSVSVSSTATDIPVTVLGGDGNDLLVAGTGTLDTLLATVNIDGVTGLDRLTVNDSGDSTDNDYVVNTTAVVRATGSSVTINYAALDQVVLSAGSGNDSVLIPIIAAGTPVSIDAGPGEDVVTAGAGTLDNLLGALTVDGGAGLANRLVIDDSTDSTDNAYSILPATVSRTNGTPVSIPYTTRFQVVLLRAGAGNDSIVANSTAAIPVSADGGAGSDSFNLGFLSGSILGGTETDTIVGDNVARVYTLTAADAGTISGILGGGFAEVENLAAGTADDAFFMNNGGSLSGAAFGGAGIDTLNGNDTGSKFNLTGSNSGSVDDLGNSDLIGSFSGLEVVIGGAGDDMLVVARTCRPMASRDSTAASEMTRRTCPRGRRLNTSPSMPLAGSADSIPRAALPRPAPRPPSCRRASSTLTWSTEARSAKTDTLTGLAGQSADWEVWRAGGVKRHLCGSRPTARL